MGDEALVLDVTDLEEIMGFLQDGVLSHVPALTLPPVTLTFSRLFTAPPPSPYSLGHRGGRGAGAGAGSSKSCHGICRSAGVSLSASSVPSHEPSVEEKDPGEDLFQDAVHPRL